MKRLITTITTGRSGTHFLANLLNASVNCAAEHEDLPRPSFVLERFNRGMVEAARARGEAYAVSKAQDIFGLATNPDVRPQAIGGRPWAQIDTYALASHVMCKCVAHPKARALLDELEILLGYDDHRVIHLRRHPRQVVESMLSNGNGPSDFPSCLHFGIRPGHPLFGEAIGSADWPGWKRWYGRPDGILEADNIPGRAALCLWEWCQIEALAAYAAGEGWTVQTFELPELNIVAGRAALSSFCGVEWDNERLANAVEERMGRPGATATNRRVRLTKAQWDEAQAILRGETGLSVG